MAESNVSPLTLTDARRMLELVHQGRAIARSVALAVTAHEDGSASLDGGPTLRWWAALDVVVECLDDLAGECADVCTQLDGQPA